MLPFRDIRRKPTPVAVNGARCRMLLGWTNNHGSTAAANRGGKASPELKTAYRVILQPEWGVV